MLDPRASPVERRSILAVPASQAFARFVLRTTDVAAARAFYAKLVVGPLIVVPLHEQALARGARPHWLGQIEVDDVEARAAAFVAEGAEMLGPIAAYPDGRRFAVLRDPGGAIVGLVSPGSDANPFVWQQLNTLDRERVEQAYARVFGWRMTSLVQDPTHGEVRHFAWSGGDDAGAIVDVRGREGRHAHWLFHVRVPRLGDAMTVVRGEGGLVLGPFELPNGERLAVCDDPQGAAFAVRGP